MKISCYLVLYVQIPYYVVLYIQSGNHHQAEPVRHMLELGNSKIEELDRLILCEMRADMLSREEQEHSAEEANQALGELRGELHDGQQARQGSKKPNGDLLLLEQSDALFDPIISDLKLYGPRCNRYSTHSCTASWPALLL